MALRWHELTPRMFVVVLAWDHWEEFSEDEDGYVPSGCALVDLTTAVPFELRGQVLKVTPTHAWIEGRWTWLSSGEATHGVFVVVRGAVRRMHLLTLDAAPPSPPRSPGRTQAGT